MTPPGRVAAAPALLAVAPSTGILRADATRVQPWVLLATQRLAALNSSHHATVCAPPPRCGRVPAGQATQVVSHGRHHHNRLSMVSEPSSSGLNARGASPQNRHSGPPACASIHPVVLAVAACIPSSLGLLFTFVLHVGLVPDGIRALRDPRSHRPYPTQVAAALLSGDRRVASCHLPGRPLDVAAMGSSLQR
jgi:hypothetical protein